MKRRCLERDHGRQFKISDVKDLVLIVDWNVKIDIGNTKFWKERILIKQFMISKEENFRRSFHV